MQLTVNKLIELSGADIEFFEWSGSNNRYVKIYEWNDFLGSRNVQFAPKNIGNRVISSIKCRHDGSMSVIVCSDTYEDPRKDYLETKVQKLDELLDEMEKILEIRKKI